MRRQEELARRYQFREGLDLVDYAEVGLPIFRLTIEAVTMVHKPMPTIDEFVLKSIGIGERTPAGIAHFLGLEPELVEVTVGSLLASGMVHGDGRDVIAETALTITDGGTTRLKEEAQYEPQEEMLVIDYDGIRRKPIWIGVEYVARAAELASAGALQIRPYPAAPPDINELKIPEISRVIRRQSGETFNRDILALKRIVRRANVFREGLGLVFRNPRSKEVQIAFVVADRLADDYEMEFARNAGPKKMGLIRAVDDSDLAGRLKRKLGQNLWSQLPEQADLTAKRVAIAAAREEMAAQEIKAESRGGVMRLRKEEQQEYSTANQKLIVAERLLTDISVRPLAPYEHREFLTQAIQEAQEAVHISSSSIHPLIADGHFFRDIDMALERGVRVEIELSSEVAPKTSDAFDPLEELNVRAHRNTLLTIKTSRKDDGLYYLFKDDDLGVISTKPFLGERGKRPSFVCISGVVTHQPATVALFRSVAGPNNRKVTA